MTDAAIIRATYETYRHVPSRKVVQIVLEVPAEGQTELFKAIGYPNPAESVWVAVALLRKPGEDEPEREATQIEPTRRTAKLSQIAGILCNEGAFRKFIRAETVDEAADYIRNHCRVSSRANIDGNPDATAAFNTLKGEYELWLRCEAA